MDVATGVSALQSATEIGTATFVYLQQTMPAVNERVRAVRSGRSQAAKVQAFHQIRTIVAPIIEYMLTQTEDLVQKIERAFQVEEIFPLGDDIWSMGLVALDQSRRSLDMACDTFRLQAQKSALARVLWPPEWASRYEAVIDAIEDYSETIALGLDPDTRSEIQARLASVR
jgi:hypothetical protein